MAAGERLGQALETTVAACRVPGAVLAVRIGGLEATWPVGVSSTSTGVPVSQDTVFQVGSLSKLVTAALVLQAVEGGRIDLDAPLSEVAGLRQRLQGRPAITVRQLLSHTSGLAGDHLPDFADPFGRADDCLERFVAALPDIPQLHAPGAAWSYSNNGYVLLGRLVELCHAMTFDEAVRRLLGEPLGMCATGTLPEQAILHRVAVGHRAGPPPTAVTTWAEGRWVGPAGAVHATAGDMLRLAVSLDPDDDGPSTLGRAMRHQALQPRADVPRGAGRAEVVGTHWGLGWQLHRWGGVPVAGHNGWVAGQRSYLRIIPGARRGFVLLTNSDAGDRVFRALLPSLCRQVLDVKPPHPLRARQAAPASPARYTGRYAANLVDVLVSQAAGRLVMRRDGGEPEPLRMVTARIAVGDRTSTPMAFTLPDDGSPATAIHTSMRLLPRVGEPA